MVGPIYLGKNRYATDDAEGHAYISSLMAKGELLTNDLVINNPGYLGRGTPSNFRVVDYDHSSDVEDMLPKTMEELLFGDGRKPERTLTANVPVSRHSRQPEFIQNNVVANSPDDSDMIPPVMDWSAITANEKQSCGCRNATTNRRELSADEADIEAMAPPKPNYKEWSAAD